MKLLICSDIHGDYDAASEIISIFNKGAFDKLIILGDVLYHGPRNDLPAGYAPKKVIAALNEIKDKILFVRGNCDTEVDQMVLEFPILADYAIIYDEGLTMFLTHGHKFNKETLSTLSRGDILLHGHTHIPCIEEFGNKNFYINPGSTSIPKNGFPKSYMVYENRKFTILDINNNVIMDKSF